MIWLLAAVARHSTASTREYYAVIQRSQCWWATTFRLPRRGIESRLSGFRDIGSTSRPSPLKKESNCHQQRVHWYLIQEGHLTLPWFWKCQQCLVSKFFVQQLSPELKKRDSCIQSSALFHMSLRLRINRSKSNMVLKDNNFFIIFSKHCN